MPIFGLTAKGFVALSIIVMALTLSCGSATPTPPTTPTPTPTSIPLPTATPEPTIPTTPDWELERLKRDRLAEQLLIEADSIAADARPPKRGDSRALEADARHYVSFYLASACVNAREASIRDFRLFFADAIGRRILVHRVARREIQVIASVTDNWRRQTLDAATQHCLQPYLFPESLTDAAPAVNLYLASQLPALPPLAKGGFEADVRARASEWFDQPDQQEPYIAWLCGDDC